MEPTTAIVRAWASPLGKPVGVAFEMAPVVVGLTWRCKADGCSRGGGSRALRVADGAVLCDVHLAEQCVGSSAKGARLSDWPADGRCVGCWTEVTTMECWLLSSGHRACATCAAAVASELQREECEPAPWCLGCAELLRRPLRFGLDGRARCTTCSCQLVSATTIAQRTAVRLVLLWLRSCNQLMSRFVGTARGVETRLGCRLVRASLLKLHNALRPTCEAFLPVSVQTVAPSLARVTLELAHEDWNLRGLADTPFGQWAFTCLRPEALSYRLPEELDGSPPREDVS